MWEKGKRTWLLGVLVVGAALILAACAPRATPPAPAATPAPPPPTPKPAPTPTPKVMKTVKIAIPHPSLFTTGLPHFVALEKGFYEEEGLKVEAFFTRGGGETVQTVVAGDMDMGFAAGTGSVIGAFKKGGPITVVAGHSKVEVFWYVRGDSPLKTLEDLAGKKIAYTREGSRSHAIALAVRDLLKARGLKPPEVVSTGGFGDTFTAVKTGQVDAGVLTPDLPAFHDKLASGEIRPIFYGEDIPGFKGVTVGYHVANNDFLRREPEVARAFFRAHQKALDFMFQNRDETMEIWKRRSESELPVEVLKKVYEFRTPENFRLKPIEGIDIAVKQAVELGFIKEPLTQEELERLFNLDYLPK